MSRKTQTSPRSQPTSVVTGAAGFLGSHLTDLLLARGHKVIGIDNLVTGSVDNISHLGGQPRLQVHRAGRHRVPLPGRAGGLRLALRLARQPD